MKRRGDEFDTMCMFECDFAYDELTPAERLLVWDQSNDPLNPTSHEGFGVYDG